jgi:hypothetical protein
VSSQPVCLHCSARRASQARGLCHRCYPELSIRLRYPIARRKRRFYPAGLGCKEYRRELPHPTTARPGSEAKVAVLAYRAENELLLWHPRDARLPD